MMAKQGTSTAVPRLRFPGFRSNPWDSKPLEEIAPLQRGFDVPSSDLQRGNVPVVYSNGVQRFHNAAMAKAPGLTTGRSGTIGKLHFIESGEYWPHNTSLWVTSFKGNVPKFVYFLFDSIGMGRFASGSGVPTLNRNDVHAFVSAVPRSLAEQQKIADCLTSLDEVIAAQGRKVEALKAHKRGLMQQLFPREGETAPRLRFPEFRNAPEWASKTLGSAATFFNGRAYAKEELLEGGKYQVLRVGNFFTSDRWYYSDLELEDTKYCDDGDLLYAWSASFGPRMWRGGKTIYHYHIWKVVENEGVDKTFLFYRLDSDTERMRTRAANEIGMFHITKGTIENWMSGFPGIGEQKRIADCLSFLDTQITAETEQLAALKTHKQGLMQQLFPVPEGAQA